MIQSSVFNYLNVLDKAADASWLRNEAISNNLANSDTPNYKRQDVDFEGTLRKALSYSRYKTTDERVNDVNVSNLSARTYTDYGSFSYRLDGNNVDPETENVALVSNRIKYNALMDSINSEFSSLKKVTK